MSGIIRVKKDSRYFVASNEPFNDERLSWEARGVMGYLLSKPDNWQCRNHDLMNKGPAGEHKIKRILKELRDAGYLTRKQFQDNDGLFVWVTTIRESPLSPEEIKEHEQDTTIGRLSIDGLSTDGSPIDGKPPYIVNTESSSTESVNTESINTNGIDPALRTLSDYWQTRIGFINHQIADTIKDWLNDYDLGQIMNAIDIAVKENKRGRISTAFVDSIIRRLSAEQAAGPHPLQEPFTQLTNLKPPLDGKEAERWHKEFAEIQHISGGPELAQRYMRLARDELTVAGFPVSWPGSLTKTIRRLQSQQTQNGHGLVAKVKY